METKTPEEIAKEQAAAREATAQAAAAAGAAAPEAPQPATPVTPVVVNDTPWYATNTAKVCYGVAAAAAIGVGLYFIANALWGDGEVADDSTAE